MLPTPVPPRLHLADWDECPLPPEVQFIGSSLASEAAALSTLVGHSPAVRSAGLSRRYDRDVFLRIESLSPVRSFKARGAAAFMRSLDTAGRRRGVITASTGNHAQGIAWAAKQFGTAAKIVLPVGTDHVKLRALAAFDAELQVEGSNLKEASDVARSLSEKEGWLYVEDGEDAFLMLGAATIAWEFLSNYELDALLIPVGGGNLVAGSLLAAAELGSGTSLIGIQSVSAAGATASWLTGRVVARPCETVAGGLATTIPGELSLHVMRALLRRMALVTEEDLWNAVVVLLLESGVLGEHAAAAGIAALERYGPEIDAERVGIVVTGGHLGRDALTTALAR